MNNKEVMDLTETMHDVGQSQVHSQTKEEYIKNLKARKQMLIANIKQKKSNKTFLNYWEKELKVVDSKIEKLEGK